MQVAHFQFEIVSREEIVRFGRKSARGCRKHDEHVPLTVKLYQSGMGIQQVQKKLRRKGINVSDTWICERLKEAGIETRGYRRGGHDELTYNGHRIVLRGSHTPAKVRAVLVEYVEGTRTADLSQKYAVSTSTIEKWAERAGVSRTREEAAAIRKVKEGRISPIAAARIAERMYVQEEKSLTEISEALEVCNATVLLYLKRRGVRTRSQTEGLLISHHGSLEAYRDHVHKICHLYHVDGLTRAAIRDSTGHCHRTIKAALESEFNPYRDEPCFRPWHLRIDLLEDEGATFVEAVEKVLLAWTPDPAPASSRGGDGQREYRVINSRSAAA